jgi:hypothetical protein
MERGDSRAIPRGIQIESKIRRKSCVMLYLIRNSECNVLMVSP